MPALGEGLVTPLELAAFLGISRAGVYRLADAPDGIPCVQVGQGAIRFLPSDVRAYVARRRGTAQPNTRVARLLAPLRKTG